MDTHVARSACTVRTLPLHDAAGGLGAGLGPDGATVPGRAREDLPPPAVAPPLPRGWLTATTVTGGAVCCGGVWRGLSVAGAGAVAVTVGRGLAASAR
jgi:hypothetical protein